MKGFAKYVGTTLGSTPVFWKDEAEENEVATLPMIPA
jgi:hypothetical protein